eukprot:TRINITY_DN13758_c0_g1_i1.p1 TRINITY_DN13758_c0_g1~~TRINITY_DN13758_c0_g1_i1.p1  ORF type:complete len:135 (-),score=41.64 TRINITY_DN13758_c0_g1_i1:350-754(-)
MFGCCDAATGNTVEGPSGSPIQEMGSSAPEEAPAPVASSASPRSDREFQVVVKKTGAMRIGLDISAVGQKVLKVWKVKEGLIDQWNKGRPEEEQVKAGDAVTVVNGDKGSSDLLLKNIAEHEELTVTFSRGMFA